MRVLIVEDERRLAENIARSLRESAGYAVDVALDGEDGLYMAQSNPYDLLVLDLMLPKIDGLTVLKQVARRRRRHSRAGADRARREGVDHQPAQRRRRRLRSQAV